MMMDVFEYLKKLESQGFTCYIVGGYVRDKLLGIESHDIDIATKATPKEIAKIFEVTSKDNLGCVNVKNSLLNVDITTYRVESSYANRHPKKIEYTDDILTDLKRRDFTIDAICLDSKGSVYDPLNGKEDLNSKLIKVIGDVEQKFTDDPLRILRALRFSIIYEFTIEESALEFILENKTLLKDISYDRKRMELDKIFSSNRCLEGLKWLKSLNLLGDLDIGLNGEVRLVKDPIGIWAQLDCSKYNFSKTETSRIQNIRKIVSLGRVDAKTIFDYGIEDATVASEILGLNSKSILDIYERMPIHRESELQIDGKKIAKLLRIEGRPIIKKIKETLIKEILSGNLLNDIDNLKLYILKNWK